MKNRAPAAAGARILKNRLSKLRLIFDSILVPTYFHSGTKIHPKFIQKSIWISSRAPLRLRGQILTDFEAQTDRKFVQKLTKIGPEINPEAFLEATSYPNLFFDRFWERF